MSKVLYRCLALALLLVFGGVKHTAQAQAVIFPQEKQPGEATLSKADGTYTLANDLFKVTFVHDGTTLTFGGCSQMNLLEGSDLFKIKLQSGDEVSSSGMTLEAVTMESLTGDAFAVRGVERFNGKQLVATYTYSGLSIVWRAVLRDGSHYLRTELEISAPDGDVAMESITPMLYTVDTQAAGSAPVVVGNTRGAVIANQKIFAGLETPMGKQKAGDSQDVESFTPESWIPEHFAWYPTAEEVPSDVTATGITADKIAVNRGYVYFAEAGEQTVTLQWVSGSKKLNIKGVDILYPLTEAVAASDYHAGSTGTSNTSNVYTLNVPAAGAYQLRIFADYVSEVINSSGTITYSKPIYEVEVIRDLSPESATARKAAAAEQPAAAMVPVALQPQPATAQPFARLAPAIVPLAIDASTATEVTAGGDAVNFSWTASSSSAVGNTWPSYTNVPEQVQALQTSFSNVTNRKMEKAVTFSAAGLATSVFTWSNSSGSTCAINIFGVEVVDDMDRVIASDYHHGTAGGALTNNTYTVLVPQGTYIIRYLVADVTGTSGNNTYTDNVYQNAGNAALTLTAIDALTTASTSDDTWTTADFAAVTAVPAGITALNSEYSTSNVKVKQHNYSNDTEGLLNVELRYTGGDGTSNKKLFTLGVAVIDGNGNVVSEAYGEGSTGDSSTGNVYEVYVPAGAFTLCYYASTRQEGDIHSVGRMDFTLTAIKASIAESATLLSEDWATATWTDPTDSDVPQAILDLDVIDGTNVRDVTAASVRTIQNLYRIKAGELVVEMLYGHGSKRLDAVGLELIDLKGNIVATDYHFGYTGGQKKDNVYHLTVPAADVYYLRYSASTIYQGALPTDGTFKFILQEDLPALSAANKELTVGYNGTTSWWKPREAEVPNRVIEAGCTANNTRTGIRNFVITMPEDMPTGAKVMMNVNLAYASGSDRLDLYGAELYDNTGNACANDFHAGFAGNPNSANDYSFDLTGASGKYQLRIYTGNVTTSSGNIAITMKTVYPLHLYADATTPIEGVWSRNTTLQQGKTWKVGAVVGLIAQSGTASEAGYTDQSRRSFLAYSERERAVPWRPFPTYISWYELNINRNNSEDYSGNMTVAQCTNVVNQWKANLFDKYDARVKAFVWDDGWDEYGTWDFNTNFPNGFSEPDAVAQKMGSGIGAWLGPVGGYGTSGGYRRAYWSSKGGMQLSNSAYYQVFIDACTRMIKDYDFRFFKFDGISDEFSATGPDPDLDITVAEENAEGIIGIEREIRAVKPDIFLNTTVGTWASPFWFQFTDAVWRQENDYGTIGNNAIDRENWITYRDNLVHQNFVTNSPFCPINTLMTHGFILSKYGNVSSYTDYAAIVRELRCAFACGSGMVELYNDYDLTGSVHDDDHPAGSLWKEIADCIAWQEKNSDVLPDIHWVGGDPWTGSASEVYGWASWNGRKSTLALRNGANTAQTFTTTLRQALEIPAHVTGSITFSKAFTDQADLIGLEAGTSYNIDATLTLSLPASSVYVFDGVTDGIAETDATDANMAALLLEARRALEQEGIGYPESGADITTGSDARVALAQAITAAAHKAYNPTADDIADLRAAIAAYRQGTTEIQLPEDGHAYQLTTVAEGQQYYLNYDATDGLQLILRAEGTAIPASATFVCHNMDGKTLYVNDAGHYIALTGSALTAAGTYDEGASLLQAVKTESDFGALRLGGSTMAARGWMKVAPRQAGEVTGIEGSTAFSFREAEYPNLVTLRTPTNKDGNSYASICLPFSYIIPDGVTAYRATTLDDENSLVKLVSVKGAVPAGQAVVLVSTEDVSEARLAPAGSEAQEAMSEANNLFRGVCESGVARDQDVTTYVLNGDRSTGNIGFFKYTATNLPAYKAYFTESATNPVRGYLFQFGEATLVLPAAGEAATDGNLPCYDLSGRRTRPDAKGIYIRGGKKVYVK